MTSEPTLGVLGGTSGPVAHEEAAEVRGRPEPHQADRRASTRWGWVTAVVWLLLLSGWAWHRLGLFHPYLDVVLADGTISRQPNALTTVDHPWHAARFSLLLDSLRDGQQLRWVESHQGGYPVEFYPVGSAAIDLLVWVVTLGQLPIPLVHTYAVGLTFLLPLVGFGLLCSAARISPWVAVLAGTAHLCVRGWWWSGGSMELIEWGLVTNVLAAALLLIALPIVGKLMTVWSPRAAAALAAVLALAVVTNPRSAIAVVAIGLAVLVSMVWPGDARGAPRRLAVPSLLALGLAAPLLMPLVRYRDLYYFVEYSGYASIGDWARSSIQAVSAPVAMASVAGLVICLRPSSPRVAQLAAVTLMSYALITLALVELPIPASLVDQLETTRLMPFQRLLMIAVAALGVGQLIDRPRMSRVIRAGLLGGGSVAIMLLYVIAPPSAIPVGDRGLVRIGSYAHPSIVSLERSVRAADAVAPSGSALLVLGSTVSWHDQLWGPTWTDRRLFYDDWLWYWQREHVGDYDPERSHAYDADESTLERSYLTTHGIGAVVVTGEPAKSVAQVTPWLTQVGAGVYDVYTVGFPVSLATVDGQAVAVEQDRGDELTVRPDGMAGELIIRTNWFPRWAATIDGDRVPVTHRRDGYLSVQVPEGADRVRLTYSVTTIDWISRLLAVTALVGITGLVLRPIARLGPRSASAGHGRARR